MSLDIAIELYLISEAILLGIILRIAYDILRISRRIIRRNNIIVGIEDTIYWIISGICGFVLIYDFNGGSVRVHIFLFIALGMVLYSVSLSHIFVKYVSLILLKFKFVIVKVLKKLTNKVKIYRQSKRKSKIKNKDAVEDGQKGKSKKKKGKKVK